MLTVVKVWQPIRADDGVNLILRAAQNLWMEHHSQHEVRNGCNGLLNKGETHIIMQQQRKH